MKREWALGGLGVALAVIVAVWLVRNFEQKAFEIPVGFSGEARSNPMLAAGRFLRRMGIPAQELQPHEWIGGTPPTPPARATLILTTARWSMAQEDIDRLLVWVESGGHLIVAARPDPSGTVEGVDSSDPLLQAVGVQIRRKETAEEPADAEALETDTQECSDNAETITVAFGTRPVQVTFSPKQRLVTEENYAHIGRDSQGATVLHTSLGRGWLTLLSDIGPLHNAQIGEHDHAEFLWRLIHLTPLGGPVWIVFDEDMPALPAWHWQHAREALISLGILLLIFMWNRSRRFGPLEDLPPLARRRLLEHIEASGHFLWRNGEQRYLLDAVRSATESSAARRHPVWDALSTQKKIQHLSEVTKLPEDVVRQSLLGAGYGHKHSFAHTIRDLERIRRRL